MPTFAYKIRKGKAKTRTSVKETIRRI